MAKYLVQHRRGTAEQWAEKSTIIPREGEIVIEIDEVNSLHKLKIGDGVHCYTELAYLQAGDEVVTQVLAKALPRVITVTLDIDKWTEITSETDPNLGYYGQSVSIDNITTYSRLDLQPNADMLAEFQALNLVFVTENNNGVITVYSVGDMPLKSYTMQATIIETDAAADEKIIGTPVGTPTAKSDWNQTDETQADYIKNKPDLTDILRYSEQELTEEQKAQVRSNIGAGASSFSGSYNDLIDKPIIPSVEGLATEVYVDTKIASMVDSAPETLNTLNELAEALGDDPNFATTIATEIGTKATKEEFVELKNDIDIINKDLIVIDDAIATRTQVQIITWEADD